MKEVMMKTEERQTTMTEMEASNDMRSRVAQGLARVLADSSLLYMMLRNFHWNVTGPQFHALHTMFEEQYTELITAIDEIAERIRAIGHPAPGTFSEYLEYGSVKEVAGVPDAEQMIRHLAEAHETLVETIRKVFPHTEEIHDEVTADMMIARMQVHDKAAWMLRSMLG